MKNPPPTIIEGATHFEFEPRVGTRKLELWNRLLLLGAHLLYFKSVRAFFRVDGWIIIIIIIAADSVCGSFFTGKERSDNRDRPRPGWSGAKGHTEYRKMCGLGSVNRVCRARVTQPSPHIFLHICNATEEGANLSHARPRRHHRRRCRRVSFLKLRRRRRRRRRQLKRTEKSRQDFPLLSAFFTCGEPKRLNG